MAKLCSLNWHKDTISWTLGKYRAAHKRCHIIQNKLHRAHGFQDVLPRNKVNLFLEGIMHSGIDTTIIAIKDNAAIREDFEPTQARICEFKSLLDGRLPRSQRGVMTMYGGDRGGGRGDGHGGYGRGGRRKQRLQRS